MIKSFKNLFVFLTFFCAISVYAQTQVAPAQIQNVLSINAAADTGTANAYVVSTYPIPYESFVTGTMINFKAANANTGPSTFKVNALTVKPILTNGNTQQLVSGAIKAGQEVTVIWDGTQWEMQSTSGNAVSGNPASPGNAVQFSNSAATGFVTVSGGATVAGVDSVVSPTVLNIPFSESICGPNPWIDVTCGYGAKARSPILTTTATTTASSPNVILAAARDFVNGEYVVINGAGPVTTQSTPSAPTAVSSEVNGSSTYNYRCVGLDSGRGMTAASATGSVTNGPRVFGNLPVSISSISGNGTTVTVNFLSPINASVNQHIAINGVLTTTAYNGVWLIISTPTSSQIVVTSSVTGTGTVNSGTTGRLVNAWLITSISQGNGYISVTTDRANGIVMGSSVRPTFVQIDGVLPVSFNGLWPVTGITNSTTFYIQIGNNNSITGTVSVGSSIVTAFEYNEVACPTISGTTIQYIVYGDDGTGTFAPIGETLPYQSTFRDWGKFWRTNGNGGMSFPAYVPSTPPVSATNQLYVGRILSGAGTTSLVMSVNVTAAVSGALAQHDDGQAFLAAANAASGGVGAIKIPPAVVSGGVFVVNYPIEIPYYVDYIQAAQVTANETVGFLGSNNIIGQSGSSETSGQFALINSVPVGGVANPQYDLRNQENLGGLSFYVGDGQTGVLIDANSPLGLNAYGANNTTLLNLSLTANNQASTATPLVFSGLNLQGIHMTNMYVNAYSALYLTGSYPTSQSPPIGGITFRGDDQSPNSPQIGQVILDGSNSIVGRGIVLDASYNNNYWGEQWWIWQNWDQQPITPGLTAWGRPGGGGPSNVRMENWLNDSSIGAIIGNIGGGPTDILLAGDTTSGGVDLVTGGPITGLQVVDTSYAQPVGPNTDLSVGSLNSYYDLGNGQVSGGVQLLARPSVLSIGYPFLIPYNDNSIAAPTCSASGVGTIPAGTYQFYVIPVGWNIGGPGQGIGGALSTGVALNGSQGVACSWSAVANVAGYNIGVNGPSGYGEINASTITTTSATFTSYSSSYRGGGTIDGTGCPLLDSGGFECTPLVGFANGVYRSSLKSGTLSANQTVFLPNTSGTIPLVSGSPIPGDCAYFLSVGQVSDAGAPCNNGPVVTTVASGGQSASSTTATTTLFNYVAGNEIIVFTHIGGGQTATGVTDLAGNSCVAQSTLVGQNSSDIFFICSGGSTYANDAVTETVGSAQTYNAIFAWQLANAAGIDVQGTNGSSGNNTLGSVSLSLSNLNDMVLTSVVVAQTGQIFAAGGSAQLDSAGYPATLNFLGAEHQLFATSSSHSNSMGWTISAPWDIFSIAIAPSNTVTKTQGLVAIGTAAGLTGTGACLTADLMSQLGGAWAGSVECTNTTGSSTLIITPGTTAPNGWVCSASDLTTANALRQSVSSTTACTIAGTVDANDVLTFSAIAF